LLAREKSVEGFSTDYFFIVFKLLWELKVCFWKFVILFKRFIFDREASIGTVGGQPCPLGCGRKG